MDWKINGNDQEEPIGSVGIRTKYLIVKPGGVKL
jgi:hypothetical protein